MSITWIGGEDEKPMEANKRSPEDVLMRMVGDPHLNNFSHKNISDERLKAIKWARAPSRRRELGFKLLSQNSYMFHHHFSLAGGFLVELNDALLNATPEQRRAIKEDPGSIVIETIRKVKTDKLSLFDELNVRSYIDPKKLGLLFDQHHAITSGKLMSHLLSLHTLEEIRRKNSRREGEWYRFASPVLGIKQGTGPQNFDFYGLHGDEGEPAWRARSTVFSIGCRLLFDPNVEMNDSNPNDWYMLEKPFLTSQEIDALKASKRERKYSDFFKLVHQLKKDPEETNSIAQHLNGIWDEIELTDARTAAIVLLFYTNPDLPFEERVDIVFGDTSINTLHKVKNLMMMHEQNLERSCLFFLMHELRHYFVHYTLHEIDHLARGLRIGEENFLSVLEATPEVAVVALQEYQNPGIGRELWLKQHEKEIIKLRFGKKQIVDRDEFMANVRILHEQCVALKKSSWASDLKLDAIKALEAEGRSLDRKTESGTSSKDQLKPKVG